MSNYKDLLVWQKADELAYQIYVTTKSFPKEEIYCITSQLRRAVLSVPTNIVEGYSRKGGKELLRFLYIAMGSLAETEYLLYFAKRLNYLDEKQYQQIEKQRQEVGKFLFNFCKKLDADF